MRDTYRVIVNKVFQEVKLTRKLFWWYRQAIAVAISQYIQEISSKSINFQITFNLLITFVQLYVLSYKK